MDEAVLRRLLGEPIGAVRERTSPTPAWLVELEAALASGSGTTSWLTPLLPDHPLADTLAVLEPLIRRGRVRLGRALRRLVARKPHAPFDSAEVERMAVAALLPRLLFLIGRTCVLELHVARLQGRLRGATPEARFRAFVAGLAEAAARRAILEEYPVIARQAAIRIDQWVDSTLEFLDRLCTDAPAIREGFSPDGPLGRVIGVDGGLGDSHRRGRSVVIATFSSGLSVVYKPRSLASEVHFQELLRWLNARGARPPFRTIRVLDRGTHGWVEFIQRESCESTEQVTRFYRRQGAYLAVLYALGATDLHYDNLIAAGEHPVLVDHEALFHPELRCAEELDRSDPLRSSVLRVGLLPRHPASEGAPAFDLSGLGARNGDVIAEGIPALDKQGTDEMRLIRTASALAGTQHAPQVSGVDVDVADFADEITAGFRSMYKMLCQHKRELLGKGGPVARFANDEVRVIARDTGAYFRLLYESVHPHVLGDALERDRLFDRLWEGIDLCPQLASMVRAERADLDAGDIPMFTTRPCSRDIWTSFGERLEGLLLNPGIADAARRLEGLGPSDLARQLWFTEAALASPSDRSAPKRASSELPHRVRRQEGDEPNASAGTVEPALRAAVAIGDRIATLSVRVDGQASWAGLTLARDRWGPSPLDLGLYGGIPGIALFLAYLGEATGAARFTRLAEEAMRTVRSRLEQEEDRPTTLGAFDGWGGILYTVSHLAALWECDELRADAAAIVDRIPALVAKDDLLDVMSGSAGCVLALLASRRVVGSRRTLEVARYCGEHLLDSAERLECGHGWRRSGLSRPLTGLSHGAAGVGLALVELWAATRNDAFRRAAFEAFAYERSVFSDEHGNWPDLRDGVSADGAGRPCMTAWCHGAPGIGLGRLHALKLVDDTELRQEVEVALRSTLAFGFGGNHSLCHGSLGNVEFILEASLKLGDVRWTRAVDRTTARVLDDGERSGWRCANPHGIDSPELMTGLAGIGYELLRLAAPAEIPSVLLLAPPPCVVAPAPHRTIR